jgi:hypothetical protein
MLEKRQIVKKKSVVSLREGLGLRRKYNTKNTIQGTCYEFRDRDQVRQFQGVWAPGNCGNCEDLGTFEGQFEFSLLLARERLGQ